MLKHLRTFTQTFPALQTISPIYPLHILYISFTNPHHFHLKLSFPSLPDLTISLNHHIIMYHKIHHHIYQKPHHKNMYPHFSSYHPQHIFTGIIKIETVHYSRLSKRPKTTTTLYTDCLRLTALDYPNKLITENSYPWLPLYNQKRRLTNKTHRCHNKPTNYYCGKYNKHASTDKVIRHILHKYHNIHILKLT